MTIEPEDPVWTADQGDTDAELNKNEPETRYSVCSLLWDRYVSQAGTLQGFAGDGARYILSHTPGLLVLTNTLGAPPPAASL